MEQFCFKYKVATLCNPSKHSLKYLLAGILALLLIAPAFSESGMPAVSCESLAKLDLPDATITMAQPVAAGEFKMADQSGPGGAVAQVAQVAPGGGPPPGLTPAISLDQGSNPAFCRVAATLKPSSDSDIKIEVWLPLSGWNGKFLGIANTGWAGTVMYSGLLQGVQRGYAAGSTDDGHAEMSGVAHGSFIVGHPEKLIDYGNRAVHEMTVKSKAIVAAYYGMALKYSLFTGCSLGGMQALQEAYRYPADYDGIVAGAPANPMTLFNAAQLWPGWLIGKDPSRLIPAAKYTVIHQAALKACASPIGLKQGFIDDPEDCHFDPQVLICKGADSPNCLTAPQVELMRQIYTGPVNPRTRDAIFPGPPPGAELQLPMYAGTTPMNNALALYKYAVYQDPDWDWNAMDYDSSIALAQKNVDPQMRAESDLAPFIHRGGKLMIYIGWTDYHNPLELIAYYKKILKNAVDEKPGDSVRLFAIPGMDHCFGGYGCDTFDKLGTIDKWVETGKTPERIIASKLQDGKTIRTSPLCAYPKIASYKGTGDTEDAENFACTDERHDNKK